MKTYLAIALLSLALNLASCSEELEVEDRKWLPKKEMREDGDEDEDDDKPLMDISETRKCYVYGQCQEYSLNFKKTEDAEACHKFCGKNEKCTWWTWEPAFELCMIYSNCTEDGVDPPAVEPCPECISGEAKCPARECHGAFKCKGDFVDSFAISTLEECIEKCNEIEDCQWFTLEKANDHCILYEECDDQFDCETCATGEKKCAHGYHGTTPAPPKANEDGSAVIVKVTQSSRWANAWTGTRLIDGKGLDGRWSSQACAATSDAYRPHNLVDGMEFFSLELEAPQKIAKVQIANRVDCCFYRGNNVRITVGPSPVYDPEEPLCLPEITQLSKSAGLQDYVCDGDVQGKFVKISRPGQMNICEVKVFPA